MVDADLAMLYGVTTKVLNQAVKRNKDRFPGDFMFQMTAEEKMEVVPNCAHLSLLHFSPVLPYVFTEYGVLEVALVEVIVAKGNGFHYYKQKTWGSKIVFLF